MKDHVRIMHGRVMYQYVFRPRNKWWSRKIWLAKVSYWFESIQNIWLIKPVLSHIWAGLLNFESFCLANCCILNMGIPFKLFMSFNYNAWGIFSNIRFFNFLKELHDVSRILFNLRWDNLCFISFNHWRFYNFTWRHYLRLCFFEIVWFDLFRVCA